MPASFHGIRFPAASLLLHSPRRCGLRGARRGLEGLRRLSLGWKILHRLSLHLLYRRPVCLAHWRHHGSSRRPNRRMRRSIMDTLSRPNRGWILMFRRRFNLRFGLSQTLFIQFLPVPTGCLSSRRTCSTFVTFIMRACPIPPFTNLPCSSLRNSFLTWLATKALWTSSRFKWWANSCPPHR